MRIAGGTVLRRYMHNLERNMGNKNREENKLYSGRSFNRASENPITAARALRVRKAVYDIEVYQNNLKRAEMIYENAESSVMKVSAIMQSVYEKLIQGAHGSLNRDDAGIVSETIDQFADEMVQLMNVVVADRRIFGGVNNSSLAFSIQDTGGGKVAYYHGQVTTAYQDFNAFPFSGTSYTDIGIGMTLGGDGRIDPQSAIPVTFNGMEIMGCGLDSKVQWLDIDAMMARPAGTTFGMDVSVGSNKKSIVFEVGADREETIKNINTALFTTFGNGGVTIGRESGMVINNIAGKPDVTISATVTPENQVQNFDEHVGITTQPSGFAGNVIQLVLDAAQALKADDRFLTAQYADALFALQTNVSLTLARIGNTQEFVEFNLDRTTNNKMSLLEQQYDLEGSKPEEQITQIKVFEAMFQAQLQMGAQILPMSIFNFIR